MMILGRPLTFLWYGLICVLVAVAILEEVAWHLHICNSCFLSGERIVANGPFVSEVLASVLILGRKSLLQFV